MRVAELCTEAATQFNQRQMVEEQAGEYDLAALKVDPDTASNSETGWGTGGVNVETSYEYEIETVDSATADHALGSLDHIQQMLNKRGQEGWLLVSQWGFERQGQIKFEGAEHAHVFVFARAKR